MNYPDVSIIIVNWNTKKLLRDCILSIYENTGGLNFEIIVVDNGSSDGSAEMVGREFAGVKLIANTENRGFASANNQAIAVAKSKYLLLLNSDTLILSCAIENAVAFADSHKKAAVVGCRVLNPDRTLQPTCFMFPSITNMLLSCSYLYKLFPRSRFFGREKMTWWNRNYDSPVDVVTGCFMLVRRRAVLEVGMMDESFFMYGEETDWCYRFRQAGWEVMFTANCEIIHYGGQSSQNIKGQTLIQLRLSILEFIKKHHGRLKHKIACLFTILFFTVRLPVLLAAGLFGKKHKKYALLKLRAYINGIGQIIFNSSNFPVTEKAA